MEAIHDDLQRVSAERFVDDELLDRVEQAITILNHMKEDVNDPR